MNINKKKYIVLALATLPMLNSCSESWLEPKPLSFYSPENTYVNAEGLYAALTACERNMRHEYFGDGAPILTERLTKVLLWSIWITKCYPPVRKTT